MSKNESAVPQVSNSSLNADLEELKNIEAVITSQLNELGEKIDKSFANAAQFVSTLTDFAMSFSKGGKASTTRDAIQFVGATVSSTIKGVGDAYAAYKHNKALDALLVQKQAIAKAKMDAMLKVLPKVQHLTDKFSQLVGKYASKDYDLAKLREESFSGPLYNNFDKSLGMFRAAAYNQAMAEYVLAEYNAWLEGSQQSKMKQPTYWDINKGILKQFGEPDLLELIDKYSSENASASGNELFVLHDNQLLSMLVSENNSRLFDVGLESLRPAGGIHRVIGDIEGVKRINDMLLPSPSFFDDYISKAWEHEEKQESLSKTKKVFHISLLVGMILVAILFINLSWAVWLRWVLGIICELVVLSVITGLESMFTNPIEKDDRAIMSSNYRAYRKQAGYIYISKRRLEKKSVIDSFLNNFK